MPFRLSADTNIELHALQYGKKCTFCSHAGHRLLSIHEQENCDDPIVLGA